MSDSKLSALKERASLIWNLYGCRSLLGWDQQVLLPSESAPGRAAQLATLMRVAHEMLVSDEFRRLLEGSEKEVESLDPDHTDRCLVAAARRKLDLAAGVPSKLVEDLARATALSYDAWLSAKRDNDFPSFAPHFEKVLELTRQVAEHRGYPEHIYDALIGEYEPLMRTSQVRRLFDGLRPGLVELVAAIRNSPHQIGDTLLSQHFPGDAQRRAVRALLPRIGFNLQRGRLDESPHPFCASNTSLDVRLTHRVDEARMTTSVFGVLHEAGHGLYEQGSPAEFNGSPLKGGCSLGVHESQSRLWENLVGRSLPFWKANYQLLVDHFPQQLSGYSVDDFYRAINRVTPSFIRVEADEVTYSLHVMLRFELELQLLEGSLKVRDVPEAWNARMTSDLGLTPPDDRVGCLQDVHWPEGLIGYFPTYSLGNMIASQLWRRIENEIPDLEQRIESGDCQTLLDWLRKNVHQHAAKYPPNELVRRATGSDIDHEPFLDYLRSKYSRLYQLPVAVA